MSCLLLKRECWPKHNRIGVILNKKRAGGKVKPDLRKTPYNNIENDESLEREVWKGGNMLYPVPVVLIGKR